MLKSIQRRVFRERRRFAYLTAVWLIAIALGLSQTAPVFSPFILMLASLITAAFIASVSALITSAIPFLRSVVSVMPYAMFHVGVFKTEALSSIDPALYDLLSPATLIGPIVVFTILTSWKPLQRIGQRPVSFTARTRTRLSAYTLYDGLVGRPGAIKAMSQPDAILSFEAHPETPRLQRLIERHKKTELEIIREVQEDNPPFRARYDWHLPNADHSLGNSTGTATFEIEDRGGHRIVTQTAHLDRLCLQARVYNWLDDYFGKSLDRNVRLLEKRAKQSGEAPEEVVFA